MMARLDTVATYIKSGNAGASFITFDIGFENEDQFDRVRKSPGLSAAAIAPCFNLDADDVAVFAYQPALIVKITIPRAGSSGGIEERDFDGVQQFAPLLDLEV
ncbi:DUF4387 domain-containing protein [Sphingobium sp. SCG-1]|uniref:DUF4387 family protein n=1 Tax=Sphingobium sp. SCG-1 TaxID=2072936 RepID=UPI000CD6B815|nr:DUF4387 family protein [Sphingobium sp. SCG-1]AUW57156.1 DUF4387 domain-containing protein [Sphingobium sp. SCG-1]